MRLAKALDGRRVIRLKGGLQVRLHNVAGGCVLLLAVLALTLLSLSVGFTQTGLGDLLAGMLGGKLEGDEAFALWIVRMPRILLGFMAGWLVAITGGMLQSLARNPLADPGLFGLSQGSMVMIMLVLVFLPSVPLAYLPLAAMAGGLGVALVLIWLVGGEQSSGLAILLMGIALETVLSAITSILVLYTPDETSYALSSWLAGSLFQANWSGILALLPWFLLSFPAVLVLGRALKVFDLGNEMAMALGEPLKMSRPALLFVAVLLSSASVTAVGPLSFLGVMAPHLATFLSPASGRAKLILSGLMGGALVVAADVVSRGLASDLSLPIGLSLTLVGVPLFIVSLRLRALRLALGD
ncbi:iron ABC transporter permease [Roseibium sp. CAU 1637]|uniref:Iron ABC transporter permease n=1 Tax=Roseibium limicola TaxID=2816037 RepID=A0A939J7D2_9HYPH|nr:iron ABC transporter permease [Roseibium limicola]MBO0344106.1 iron ABC transporter permease [Roseibium limicola]